MLDSSCLASRVHDCHRQIHKWWIAVKLCFPPPFLLHMTCGFYLTSSTLLKFLCLWFCHSTIKNAFKNFLSCFVPWMKAFLTLVTDICYRILCVRSSLPLFILYSNQLQDTFLQAFLYHPVWVSFNGPYELLFCLFSHQISVFDLLSYLVLLRIMDPLSHRFSAHLLKHWWL